MSTEIETGGKGDDQIVPASFCRLYCIETTQGVRGLGPEFPLLHGHTKRIPAVPKAREQNYVKTTSNNHATAEQTLVQLDAVLPIVTE